MNTKATMRPCPPLISIVTVVLNGEHTLERTIRSVITQKDDTVEYIVIDGGSRDATVDIIRRYGQYIDYWVSEPDRGVYEGMNKGIKVARGRCVGLLNCGDYYEPDTLSIVREQLLNIHDRHFVIAGGINKVDESGAKTETIHVSDSDLKKRFILMPLNHPSMFVSSSVYSDIGVYSPKFRISSDYEFVLSIIDRNVKILLLPNVLTNMRSGGLSENPRTAFVRLREAFVIRREYKGRVYCLLVLLREVIALLLQLSRIHLPV